MTTTTGASAAATAAAVPKWESSGPKERVVKEEGESEKIMGCCCPGKAKTTEKKVPINFSEEDPLDEKNPFNVTLEEGNSYIIQKNYQNGRIEELKIKKDLITADNADDIAAIINAEMTGVQLEEMTEQEKEVYDGLHEHLDELLKSVVNDKPVEEGDTQQEKLAAHADTQPVEQPAEEETADTHEQPVEDTQSVEDTQRVEEKAADTQPVEEKAADTADKEENAADKQPVEENFTDKQPVEEKAADTQPVEENSADKQPVEEKAADELNEQPEKKETADSQEQVEEKATDYAKKQEEPDAVTTDHIVEEETADTEGKTDDKQPADAKKPEEEQADAVTTDKVTEEENSQLEAQEKARKEKEYEEKVKIIRRALQAKMQRERHLWQ